MFSDSSPGAGVGSEVQAGRAILVVPVLLAVVAAVLYTAYAGFAAYRDLDNGGQQLAAVVADLNTTDRIPDVAQLESAAAQLRQAEDDFAAAHRRLTNDPALRLVAGFGPAGDQIDASAHLAAIGTDLSRAGESADIIASQVVALEQQYEGRPLTPADLGSVAQQASAISSDARPAIDAIRQELRAARVERAAVTTSGLIGPLRDAYSRVDQALAVANTAFVGYEDVRGILSKFLGVPLPA
jgi:hypothetical protein